MRFEYPLNWPSQKPRTPDCSRKPGRFSQATGRYGGRRKLTLTEAYQRLQKEIEAWTRLGQVYRIHPDKVVVTTNFTSIRRDGVPYAKQARPEDPGVAIYFALDEEPLILAIDTFTTIEQNIAGAAYALEKMRALDRYGINVLQGDLIVRPQLPAPGQTAVANGSATPVQWWQVLEVPSTASLETTEKNYRRLSKTANGNQARQVELNLAIADARKHLRQKV